MTDNAVGTLTAREETRVARAAFVHAALKAERWSVRAAAMAMGTSHTSLGARLKGETAFLADDIESVALLLKRDPIEFYGEYIRAGSDDFNPRTLVPKVAGSTPVGGTLIPFPTHKIKGGYATPISGQAPA